MVILFVLIFGIACILRIAAVFPVFCVVLSGVSGNVIILVLVNILGSSGIVMCSTVLFVILVLLQYSLVIIFVFSVSSCILLSILLNIILQYFYIVWYVV